MAKGLLTFIAFISAGVIVSPAGAQTTATTDGGLCSLDPAELKKALQEDKLLKYQSDLKEKDQNLEGSLRLLSRASTGANEGERQELQAQVRALNDKIELNKIALSYLQKALTSYSKRQGSIADCESARKRRALVERIAASDSSAADRQIALKAEDDTITANLAAAKKAHEDLVIMGSSALVYARLSLADPSISPAPVQAHSRQADATPATSRTEGDDCRYMIDAPLATLNVGGCGRDSRIRSARSFAGGDVAFPSSVLRPRGLTANLAGSSSSGTVAIDYADSFRFRATPRVLPSDPRYRVQLPWEFGYSFGVSAKDGVIFARDDVDKSIRDNIDGKATLKAGLFFNVYEGETLEQWEGRAAKLKDAAVKACRKDQASGESQTPSTCSGSSLTQWVFDVDPKSGLPLRPALAEQANSLYFRSEDDKPVTGGGVNFSASRGNYAFLDPTSFIADPTIKNQTDGGWNYTATLFGYFRINPVLSKWDFSAVPSLTYASSFGYPEGTKQRQFCAAVTVGTPFVTAGCPSYYAAAPNRIHSWTPALELRMLVPRLGPFPSFGVAPKVSYESIDESTADRWRFTLPFLAFVDKEAGLGVGVEYSREIGGRSDTASADGTFAEIPAEDSLKIVVTKTFSLTGL